MSTLASNNIKLIGESAEIFDELQRLYDSDERMPTMSDSDIIHLALLSLKFVTMMPLNTTIEMVAMQAIIAFKASKSRD